MFLLSQNLIFLWLFPLVMEAGDSVVILYNFQLNCTTCGPYFLTGLMFGRKYLWKSHRKLLMMSHKNKACQYKWLFQLSDAKTFWKMYTLTQFSGAWPITGIICWYCTQPKTLICPPPLPIKNVSAQPLDEIANSNEPAETQYLCTSLCTPLHTLLCISLCTPQHVPLCTPICVPLHTLLHTNWPLASTVIIGYHTITEIWRDVQEHFTPTGACTLPSLGEWYTRNPGGVEFSCTPWPNLYALILSHILPVAFPWKLPTRIFKN